MPNCLKGEKKKTTNLMLGSEFELGRLERWETKFERTCQMFWSHNC